MHIPVYLFYFLCLSIILLGLTLIYQKWTKAGKGGGWYWLILLSVVPLGILTPNVYRVSACGVYDQRVLLFPKDDFRMGMHCYVENDSEIPLFLEYVVYGDVLDYTLTEDMVIKPNTIKEVPSTEVHYIFEDNPSDILINATRSGVIRYRLSCDIPAFFKPQNNE